MTCPDCLAQRRSWQNHDPAAADWGKAGRDIKLHLLACIGSLHLNRLGLDQGERGAQMSEKYDWLTQARCAAQNCDGLYEQGAIQKEARTICAECCVRIQCLADALDRKENFGVWGGLNERERRAILKAYADVDDWEEWIANSSDPLAREIRECVFPKVFALTRRGA